MEPLSEKELELLGYLWEQGLMLARRVTREEFELEYPSPDSASATQGGSNLDMLAHGNEPGDN